MHLPLDTLLAPPVNARLGRIIALISLVLLPTTWVLQAQTPDSDGPRPGQWDNMISLPPFLVEDDGGQPWKVANLEGIEVLSRSSDTLSKTIVDRYLRLQAMVNLIYPPDLQPSSVVPTVLVINDPKLQVTTSRELTETLQRQLKINYADKSDSYIPVYHFWDQDTQVMYFVIDEFDNNPSPVSFTPAYFRFMLETRTPALPRWFIEGMATLIETVSLPVPPISRRLYNFGNDAATISWSDPVDKVSVQPFVWQSDAATKEMNSLVKMMAKSQGVAYLPDQFQFLTLQRILKIDSLDELEMGEASLLAYQAALFIRWILDPDPRELSAGGRENYLRKPMASDLWKFVERCATEPVTDKLFKECFGQSMSVVDTRLRGYLPFACLASAKFQVAPKTTPEFPKASFSTASVMEISRLRGRLERLETVYVKTEYPGVAEPFVDRARRTLQRAYKLGEYDDKLLAEMGLCEVDAGKDAAAKPFLAQAVRLHVQHPRAYFEFARIKYARLIEENPELHDATDQLKIITGILEAGLRQKPALSTSYNLLFEIWLRQKLILSPDQLAEIDQGAALYPRNFRILFGAALLKTSQGKFADARRLIDQGLHLFTSEKELKQLSGLQEFIARTKIE